MKKRKKYSYNDRAQYHTKRIMSFVARFDNGHSRDFKAMDAAEKKLPKIQYSDGFFSFTTDINRGYIAPVNDLEKHSAAYQRGYNAAKSAFEKSKNIKF